MEGQKELKNPLIMEGEEVRRMTLSDFKLREVNRNKLSSYEKTLYKHIC